MYSTYQMQQWFIYTPHRQQEEMFQHVSHNKSHCIFETNIQTKKNHQHQHFQLYQTKMDSTTQQLPEQSPLSLPDVTTKKKIFHLVNNILLLAFCVILFLYHIIAGLIWFISGMLGYGMSDLFMFFLNFFTLSIGITGVVSLARENMNIAYRYTLLRFNVGSAMIGLPFLSVCYLFISLTGKFFIVIFIVKLLKFGLFVKL